MSALRDALKQYVALRRALGTKLEEPARTLVYFLDFLEREGADHITSALALRWAMEPKNVQRATWARRLGMVRCFAAWLSTVDAQTEIPPQRLLAARRRRNKPHIFTDHEIDHLMQEAAGLASPTGLRALTYTTLVGLLTATGLRPGEAIALDRSDVDLDNGILSIRQTKFGKSRFVPVVDSTRRALAGYEKQRDRLCPQPRTEAFLVSERGDRLRGSAARRTFARISCAVGLRPTTGTRRTGRGPRLQDFRHRFATRKLIEWYRAGLDVSREMPKLATYLGHVDIAHTYWYLEAVPELLQLATDRLGVVNPEVAGERYQFPIPGTGLLHGSIAEAAWRKSAHHSCLPRHLPPVIPVCIAATAACPSSITYRGPRCVLPEHISRPPRTSAPQLHSTRNNRLAAVHAFFQYVAVSEPSLALQCQRILAIPSKRFERGPVEFLTEEESTAVVAAPDPASWIGRRDRALLLVATQTGLRNSEITSLRCQDVQFGTGAHIRCLGKGRKMRYTPLRQDVVAVLKQWMAQQGGSADDPVFPSSNGGRLSADALQRLVSRHVATARRKCPSLTSKKVTPHTLRHGAAMSLLHRGVDLSVIALWLGHESTETTQMYLHADMQLKEKALAHASPSRVVPDRYRPPDALLAFLENL